MQKKGQKCLKNDQWFIFVAKPPCHYFLYQKIIFGNLDGTDAGSLPIQHAIHCAQDCLR
jgi:hypothetical protein